MPHSQNKSGDLSHSLSPGGAKPEIPGTASCKMEYGLHEVVMSTVMSDKVKDARRATIESKPDILGVTGVPWSSSVLTGIRWEKHGLPASSELMSNTLLTSNIPGKDFRQTCGPVFSPTRSSGRLDRGSAEWSTSSSNWNESNAAMDISQRNKAIDELTARSLKHTRVMTNKLTSNGTKPYFGPVDQQTRIVEKIREQKQSNEEERYYDDLVKTWGKDGADHLLYIKSLREAKQRQASDRMHMIRNTHSRRSSHPPKRTARSDLEAVRVLDDFCFGEEMDNPSASDENAAAAAGQVLLGDEESDSARNPVGFDEGLNRETANA